MKKHQKKKHQKTTKHQPKKRNMKEHQRRPPCHMSLDMTFLIYVNNDIYSSYKGHGHFFTISPTRWVVLHPTKQDFVTSISQLIVQRL